MFLCPAIYTVLLSYRSLAENSDISVLILSPSFINRPSDCLMHIISIYESFGMLMIVVYPSILYAYLRCLFVSIVTVHLPPCL